MKTVVLALCFMAVFEGIFPLVAPGVWKDAVSRVTRIPNGVLQKGAAVLIALGLAGVWFINGL